jgi:DNA-binding IclR family transcriptional regulator
LSHEARPVYLDKIGGSFGMRLPSRVGGRQPAHCTAVGKTLLAFADDRARRESLAIAPRGRTSGTITSERLISPVRMAASQIWSALASAPGAGRPCRSKALGGPEVSRTRSG